MTPLLACLIVLLLLGLVDRRLRDVAWREVPIRVHVNGTRGKSTVTRLVWSALREAGVPAIAKTTGTAPRLLLPDGSERPFPRRAAAAIREQLVLLRLARRHRARAVVAECMALDPELQWVSERKMIGATVGVITNVRTDHTEIMGSETSEIAATLANTIPAGGVLVTGEPRFAEFFAGRARALGARVVVVPAEQTASTGGWLRENQRIALAVTRELGIDDEVAGRGFARAPRDPGAATRGTLEGRAGQRRWLDATAANDPESLGNLLAEPPAEASGPETPSAAPRLVVYNNRADRAARLATFATRSPVIRNADRLVVTGDRPPWTVWRRLRRVRGLRPTHFVPTARLAMWLHSCAEEGDMVFCGNTRGLDVARVLREATRD